MDVFIARQAIFDRDLSLFGYELLFRSCQENRSDTNTDSATLHVLSNTLLSSGLHALSADVPVFVNFGRELLTSEWTSVFPPSAVIIEILENVPPDAEVIDACRRLKEIGYRIALDDVVGSERDFKWMDAVSFVKVDFRATTREQQAALASELKRAGKRLVAEKVETHAEFVFARDAGYDLFQGFFFARPTLLRGCQLPNAQMNGLRLMRELQNPALDFRRLESIIQSDVSLTYKLFRYVNSALFARRKQICSIHEALMILGELDIRRWMTLATLPGLATGHCEELVVHALVRAKFCELLAAQANRPDPSDLFLTGLFSLLDALVDAPLPSVLAELCLPDEITAPLLNPVAGSPDANLFRAALAYESADWQTLNSKLPVLRLPEDTVGDHYLAAVSWAGEMLGGILGERVQKPLQGPESSVGTSLQNMNGSITSTSRSVPTLH